VAGADIASGLAASVHPELQVRFDLRRRVARALTISTGRQGCRMGVENPQIVAMQCDKNVLNIAVRQEGAKAVSLLGTGNEFIGASRRQFLGLRQCRR